MPVILPYNRTEAVNYASTWALKRNPRYYDFSALELGGDCTNFISQCLYAGSKIMNFTPIYGWYYRNLHDRSPSWTGVKYLHQFLTTNKTKAVFAKETNINEMKPGDVIQLGNQNGLYYHSLLVMTTGSLPSLDNITISTHTYDSFMRPLNTYEFEQIRFLHILGVYS